MCILGLDWFVFTRWLCLSHATSHDNGNLINKRGTFDDSQVSTAEADGDIKVGQKSVPALAGPATAAMKLGDREAKHVCK